MGDSVGEEGRGIRVFWVVKEVGMQVWWVEKKVGVQVWWCNVACRDKELSLDSRLAFHKIRALLKVGKKGGD